MTVQDTLDLTRPAPAVIDLDGLHALVGRAPRPWLQRRRSDTPGRRHRLRGDRVRGRAAGRLDRGAGGGDLPARAPRRRGPLRLSRRAALVEALAAARAGPPVAGAPRRGRQDRVRRGAAPRAAVRLLRRPLLRPARDRHAGPCLRSRAPTSIATTPPGARARSSSQSTAASRAAPASAPRWAPARAPRAVSTWR